MAESDKVAPRDGQEAFRIFLGWSLDFGPDGQTVPIWGNYRRYTKEELARKWPPTEAKEAAYGGR